VALMSDVATAAHRNQIAELKSAIEALPPENRRDVDSLTRHYFADGAYAREMTIPAGMVAVGKIHKTAHICVVTRGIVDVIDAAGGKRRIVAPATFVSPPGTQRAAHAITETVWTVFHPTHERDLARIEAQFIAPDFEQLEQSGALDAWLLDKETPACPGV
jgi:hypothetical protein